MRRPLALAILFCAGVTSLFASFVIAPQHSEPSSRCEAHVIEADREEKVSKCGDAIELDTDFAVAWVESDKRISRAPFRIRRSGTFRTPPMVPAGELSVKKGNELSLHEQLHVISLSTPPSELLFERILKSGQRSVLTPVGGVIAMLVDRDRGVTAVARPVEVSANGASIWAENPTRSVGSVVATIGVPTGASIQNLRLSDGTKESPADVYKVSVDRAIAVWYSVEPGRYRLDPESADSWIKHDEIEVRPGAVTSIEQSLHLLPSLTVNLGSPPTGTTFPAAAIEVLASSGKSLRRIEVSPSESYKIALLPPEQLIVTFRIGEFVAERRVYLGDGDQSVNFELEPIRVHGTVYRGNDRAEAMLRFEQRGDALSVSTDASGAYEVVLWQPRRYVIRTKLLGRTAIPEYLQMTDITESQMLDIQIPANAVAVHVFDRASGKTIIGARISVSSMSAMSGEQVAESIVVDGDATPLPPQQIGTTEISASAKGYKTSAPLLVSITDDTRERLIDVPMERIDQQSTLKIVLANGSPAAGAQVAAVAANGQLIWGTTADDAGQVGLPQLEASLLLVRHPSAASFVVPFSKDLTQLLLPEAAQPLLVTVVHGDGEPIGTSPAELTIWFGDIRLTGAASAFVTWSFGASLGDGTWIGRGLPRQPVRILFTRGVPDSILWTGAFDTLATTLPFPWRSSLQIRLAKE